MLLVWMDLVFWAINKNKVFHQADQYNKLYVATINVGIITAAE